MTKAWTASGSKTVVWDYAVAVFTE